MRTNIAAICLLALAAGCASGGHDTGYHPVYNRSTFTADVSNPWFPLKPGTTLIYRGMRDGKASRDMFFISADVKRIDGVPCRLVQDRLYLDGKLAERTTDYYSQDAEGNVWYFGEDTAELDAAGKVTSTEGTWRTGRDGAQPGIFMDAQPKVGDAHRQEYYKGHAEDRYRILSLSSSVTVPYGHFDRTLRTEERTALEPDVVDNKYYVRGIGEVEERSVTGAKEHNSLVEVRTS